MTVLTNVWLSVRDDFDAQDEQNIAFLAHAADADVVGGLYKPESGQGRTWDLWSLIFRSVKDDEDDEDEDNPEMDAAIDDLQSRNPGRTKVLGVWNWNGSQYKDANPGKGGYNQYPQLIRYMPDVSDGEDPPSFIPATTLSDVNLLAGQTPRDI